MNLYRLDPSTPMDPLRRRYADAKRVARDRAMFYGCEVRITRIDGRTLRLAHVATATPGGDIQAVRPFCR